MTDIKQVSDWALTIAAEAAGSKLHHYERMADDNRLAQSIEAHARAIEQHEAFRKEVSDAVEAFFAASGFDATKGLVRFIITKPDPLVEVLGPIIAKAKAGDELKPYAEQLRAALAKRGLEIREIEG